MKRGGRVTEPHQKFDVRDGRLGTSFASHATKDCTNRSQEQNTNCGASGDTSRADALMRRRVRCGFCGDNLLGQEESCFRSEQAARNQRQSFAIARHSQTRTPARVEDVICKVELWFNSVYGTVYGRELQGQEDQPTETSCDYPTHQPVKRTRRLVLESQGKELSETPASFSVHLKFTRIAHQIATSLTAVHTYLYVESIDCGFQGHSVGAAAC